MSFPVLHHPLFVFDLDDTITKCETMPVLAREIGMEEKIKRMTEKCMAGSVPFQTDFPSRVHMLEALSVSRAQEIAAHIPLHGEIARFIQQNPSRCLIMTGNLDVWIAGLLDRLHMKGRCLSSRALVENDHIKSIVSVLDKRETAKSLSHPFIAIGDGDNDIGMLEEADFGIGFAGSRQVSDHVRKAADVIANDEFELYRILNTYLDS